MQQELASTAVEPDSGRISTIEVESFERTLARYELELRRGETNTLQINVGLVCNQACGHCHLEAGPGRTEVMSRETVDETVAYAKRVHFEVVDITGGAPEMNPHLGHLVEAMAPLTSRLLLRANLTALAQPGANNLVELCKENRVVIVASLPGVSPSQIDSQRGKGVSETSIAMLGRLNDLGYGKDESGLELNLVSNPTGAFLPVPQAQAEKKFRSDLYRKWGLVFNNLFTFANVPLGRFLSWLKQSGNFDPYMKKLAGSFNPCTVTGLMCRTFVSVNWDGNLYDCDFNLARGAYLGGRKRHVSRMKGLPEPGTRIPTGNHCYACTAGAGFT
jgi:radical SAM/Cys-rich protein